MKQKTCVEDTSETKPPQDFPFKSYYIHDISNAQKKRILKIVSFYEANRATKRQKNVKKQTRFPKLELEIVNRYTTLVIQKVATW